MVHMTNPIHHAHEHHKGGHHHGHPKQEITCPHCGRQLMERKGVLRRLKPVSNAFVIYGHCMACHSDDSGEGDHACGDTVGETEEKKDTGTK
jgi:hypothetical protein|mmetsp:Transcript_12445/g.27222  ORF Transcript_12445/g.27222 Transcript_12445/m.27222 type:complete len:92 (+) Transcript_12445:153-428(+)|eukprot:scaffold659_cov314-Alexandrium_tamarense.AAC.5